MSKSHRLRGDRQQVHVAHRHANRRKLNDQPHNLRSAVEATVRSIKHPFGNGKLPVRGRPRMSMMLVASAAMTNIRRIWRKNTAPRPAPPAFVARLVEDVLTMLQFVAIGFTARVSHV
jgi:hypothetical protein